MPLLDHFRPPLSDRRHWESFHSRWAAAIADDLNARLPPRFVAEITVSLGSTAEADVAEWDDTSAAERNGAGGTAVAAYAPPVADVTIANEFPPGFAVEIRDLERSLRLAGVVELVSPANKDRPAAREAFAAKMAGYLRAAVGLVVVDVVTDKLFNLNNAFARLAEHPAAAMPNAPPIYAAAYRPAFRDGGGKIDVWHFPLAVGEDLPAVPFAVRGYGCLPLDLDASYAETCRRTRVV